MLCICFYEKLWHIAKAENEMTKMTKGIATAPVT